MPVEAAMDGNIDPFIVNTLQYGREKRSTGRS
jgi:hypothetical protein